MRSPRGWLTLGRAGQAVGADAVAGGVKGAQGFHHQAGPDQGQAAGEVLAGQKAQGFPFAGKEGKAHLRAGQGQA